MLSRQSKRVKTTRKVYPVKKYSLVAKLLSAVTAAVIATAAQAAFLDLRATLIGQTELANGFDQRITFDVKTLAELAQERLSSCGKLRRWCCRCVVA